MNLPNKLTVLRIFMAPIFLITLVCDFPFHYPISLGLFIVASLTDLVDGKYARKHKLVTDFGKFLDPLADKMLTTAAFLGFIALNIGQGIVFITFIVLVREFLITSLRLISVGKGKVIAANIWGKAKTVSQMVGIILAILVQCIISMEILPQKAVEISGMIVTGALWISAALTIISGVIYLVDNIEYIDYRK
ncbi:MAG: CDP-diacylglycerol--glycerol-3-phosphate 3-phosphatidyltransferase [Oscillospiraceae bacterium]